MRRSFRGPPYYRDDMYVPPLSMNISLHRPFISMIIIVTIFILMILIFAIVSARSKTYTPSSTGQ